MLMSFQLASNKYYSITYSSIKYEVICEILAGTVGIRTLFQVFKYKIKPWLKHEFSERLQANPNAPSI